MREFVVLETKRLYGSLQEDLRRVCGDDGGEGKEKVSITSL